MDRRQRRRWPVSVAKQRAQKCGASLGNQRSNHHGRGVVLQQPASPPGLDFGVVVVVAVLRQALAQLFRGL